ncbi:MAG: Rne/Rng family ribonuclease, partial [Rhodospirillaceae bacterium]
SGFVPSHFDLTDGGASDDQSDSSEAEAANGDSQADAADHESEADHGSDADDDGPGKVMPATIPVESVSEEPGSEEPETPPAAAVQAETGEESGDETEEADAPSLESDLTDAAGDTDGHDGAEEAAEPIRVDTIGGDEADEDEEVARRRPRSLRSYKIQEVIKRRQILLVQVTKEERGTKGAALTTYLSLPGRYCVLMPNTGRGGGVSRKITNPQDRKRLKEMLSDLDIPQGMAVILRTAGLERSKAEIKRDLEYLLRLWDSIREQTLQSTAPELIYEEANLIKRSIRDLYANDIDEVLVEGEDGYRVAKDFMRMLVPSQAKRVQPYRDETIPLFFRYQVESQIDAMHSPVVQLKSGGYIVINQTEALVAIDVNSGRSTRERNIEETAFKTNLEAADEVARQLRLRDLAGLIVIDFIDMEDNRNNAAVERRLKEAMKNDRARIQLGRISPFGLLELSRQRLRPSLLEANFEKCPHCSGLGVIRSIESAALHALRAIEEEGIRRRSSEISVALPSKVALYILNTKRAELALVEQRYGLRIVILTDDELIVPDLRIERVKARLPGEEAAAAIATASA